MRKSFRVLLITLHALKKGNQFVKRTLCLILTLLTFVTLAFAPNAFAQDTPLDYVVRTIYFVPKDRESNPDMDRKLDALMKRAKQFYADLMEYHEFGEKTFRLETDATGNTIVHHVTGKFNNAYYQNREERNGSLIVWDEIEEQFDTSKNIYVLVLDTSDGIVIGDLSPAGLGGGDSHSGNVLLPAHNYNAALHELGHAFGLAHDSRAVADRWTESGSTDPMITSFCAAEWLDANRYFNSTQAGFDDAEPSVEMLTPSLVSAPITIRLQFEVADSDGLHQAQLFGEAGIIACKKLEGQTTTFEFITADVRDNSRIVRLRLIDVHGNFTWHRLSIDLSDLLQPTATVSIPDSNLEAAVREKLGLASDATITQLVMLRLTLLNASNQQITDLTGLEYALNLQFLNLTDNQIEDITPLTNLTDLTRITLSGNPVTDIMALAKLVKLSRLNCHECNISNITPLAGLTNMKDLRLSGNPISDITPLEGLTNVTILTLGYSERLISDITPLEGLVNLWQLTLIRASISDIQLISKFKRLSYLSLYDLPISDLSPLTGLKGLNTLWLRDCEISDVSPLSGLKNLKLLALDDNQISDVSPLSELVNLRELRLQGNPIEDTQPLIALLHKNPDVKIYLQYGAGPLVSAPVSSEDVFHKVVFSEVMFESVGGEDGLPQWIEVYNNSTKEVNLRGWKLHWKRLQPTLLEVTTTFKEDFRIPAQQSRLIITALGRHSGGGNLSDEVVYQLHVLHAEELAQNDIANRNRLITRGGFSLKLTNSKGVLVDHIGTLIGDKQSWQLHGCLVEGVRTSLIRRFDEGVPRAGTERRGWRRAIDAKRLGVDIYYGSQHDLGTPGYRRGKPLPVELSQFSARFVKDEVVINWTTESELNNAGFNVLRSTSRTKNFRPINPKLIQGAGTTGERNEYTWTDTTAKPNTVYYYQIEDVSHAGVHKQLATVRLRGLVSASGKFITRWADLKSENP